MSNQPEISIVLPCRNEQCSLRECITKIQDVFEKENIDGEIIVSDSSEDISPDIANEHNTLVIKHDEEGYGIACLHGFRMAKGRYVFMADCDGTYDFAEIPKFLQCLREGADFVIGNRFKGEMEPEAMPKLHRYLGNPVLTGILQIFFHTRIGDVHCGMRAASVEALRKMRLKTTGMEFASEMVVQAVKKKLKIVELPINYHCRKGTSKLRSFSDGWRHLRFMLLYSPLFLFFIPGAILFGIGAGMMVWLLFQTPEILGVKLYYHPMFLASVLMIIGYQIMIFAFFAKTYAITHLGDESAFLNKFYQFATIEKGGLLGLTAAAIGFFIFIWIFLKWVNSGFGELQEVSTFVVALTLITLGFQTVFSSFMLSILGIKEK